MNIIVPAFQKSLLEPTIEAIADITEVGIDTILDEGLVKDVPIIGTIVGLAKTAQNIYDRNLLKQTLTFIKTFNEGYIDIEKINKYRDKLNIYPKKAEEELGRVLVILNSNIDVEKSRLLAKVFRSYINETVTWDEFCEFSEAISRLFVIDLELLKKIFNHEVKDTEQCQNYMAERLASIGFLDSSLKTMWHTKTTSYIYLNQFGKKFCSIIFNI